MTMLFYISLLIIVIYCSFILYCSFYLKVTDNDSGLFPDMITVIIPCRNEAGNIGRCLDAILGQTLSRDQFRVILVDDFSEDDTLKIAEQFLDRMPLTILNNPVPGKKNALTMGVNHSGSEFIITTDADCCMHPEWMSAMLNEFKKRELNLLCGPVGFNNAGSLFEQLQQSESAAVVGISAVMLNKGKPATCNGANLMFRKSVFNQIGGYQSHLLLATGDDDLLMQEFYMLDPSRVYYALNKNAMVYTKASTDFKIFLNQRIRWLAKRKYYTYTWNGRIQKLVFFQLLSFYFLLFYGLTAHGYLAFTLILFKYLSDMVFGIRLQSVFKFKLIQIVWMPFFECYIFIVLFLSLFKNADWKGRSV